MTTPNAPRRSALLAELFPALAVAAYELKGSANPVMLLPEEAAACETFRAKRLEEFTAGRLCARGALGEFGFSGYAVGRSPGEHRDGPTALSEASLTRLGFAARSPVRANVSRDWASTQKSFPE